MDIGSTRSLTPLGNSTLLPMLLLGMSMQKYSPNTAKSFKKEYDYIIVGAGSAGSVVASRLSEMPCVTVLLLEAGGPPPLLSEIPAIATFFPPTDFNWQFMTVPQKHTAREMTNQQVSLPLGKALGGSSILNAMLSVRGNKKNYDDWEAAGAEGWSYKDVFPYFIKLEDNRDPEYVANGYHGVCGPVTVHRPRYQSEVKDPIFAAAKSLGYKVVDPNAATQIGFYDLQSTMRSGQRCSTAKSYLVPAENRTNLDILPNAMVRKILMNHRIAVGVQFDYHGTTYEVKARKEVIVSAGAINTPKLLMLSGIGPRKELKRHKIPVIAHLPVGKNLHDHAAIAVNFVLSPTIPNVIAKVTSPVSIMQYMQNRTGPLASSQFISVLAFFENETKLPHDEIPDYEMFFVEVILDSASQIGITPQAFLQVFAPYIGRSQLQCGATQLRPKSRGTVTLKSTDPYDPPLIDPNYLEDPSDIKSLVEGMKTCMRISTHPEMKRVGAEPLRTRFPSCEKYAGNDDLYFECQAKAYIIAGNHHVGTARMGALEDPRTVVDPKLRVKNVKRLRVVDASIMPTIPSGNTNIPTIMVAEKASDIIKETINCYKHAKFDYEEKQESLKL